MGKERRGISFASAVTSELHSIGGGEREASGRIGAKYVIVWIVRGGDAKSIEAEIQRKIQCVGAVGNIGGEFGHAS